MRYLIALCAALLPLSIAAAQPVPALPQASDPALLTKVAELLAQAPAGTRYGMLVRRSDGSELLSIAPDARFMPASNTKVFTTAAAYSRLAALDRAARGTGVFLEPASGGGVHVVLYGRGDARLSSAPDCTVDCLQELAAAVAAQSREVVDVIGDDSWFPDERWSPGMSWNNIPFRYGTGISALTLDDNELSILVRPGAPGAAPEIDAPGYYTIENAAQTVAGEGSAMDAMRLPNSMRIRLSGTIGTSAEPVQLRFGIDDPAHYAAWRMRALLEDAGVTVRGSLGVRHRPLAPGDDPANRDGAPAQPPARPRMLAEIAPLPLADDIRIINKESQNLHAELMLRRLARDAGSGAIAEGEAVLHDVFDQAGVPPDGWTLADGSGMSSYNRVTPRALVALLDWAARQPWGGTWRDTLPIGGIDGTLRSRFADTTLYGRVFAKTGSLNASRALSGYLVAASGDVLVFSAIANDIPPGGERAATEAMDAALVAIAQAN